MSQALLAENNAQDPTGDRGRKATLDGLTTNVSQLSGRSALFDDSVRPQDVPGSLHLANDDHIERLVARTGAVKLIRQFARDLALRDAEISALRLRADERERELKKMLREVEVSNQDIEHRLYLLENPTDDSGGSSREELANSSAEQRSLAPSINDMMGQAMLEDVGIQLADDSGPQTAGDLDATIRPSRQEFSERSRNSSIGSVKKHKKPLDSRGWQDYIWGSSTVCLKTSRASSVMGDAASGGQRISETGVRKPSSTGNRRKAIDGQLFQPPGSNSESTAKGNDGNQRAKQDGDNRSITSQRSSRSVTSWTVRLFAGNSESSRTRSRSRAPDTRHRNSSPSLPSKGAVSAMAALKRINGTTGVQSLSGRSSASSSIRATAANNSSASRRNPASAVTGAASTAAAGRNRSSSTNLGPVEMDAILPMDLRPPTLAHIYGDYESQGVLTDRFGFIYDQRRNKRQKEATEAGEISATSSNEDVPTLADLGADNVNQTATTNTTNEDTDNLTSVLGKWQDYLRIATKPTELLSHTPAAGPAIQVEQEQEPRARGPSVAIGKGGSLSVVNTSPQASASTSAVVSNHAEFAGNNSNKDDEPRTRAKSSTEQEPVKLLLQRLTDLHDASQGERTVKWNEFMRKVRAERRKEGEAAAAASAQDRASVSLDTPEASIADGEVVGIAGLGNKGKIGRAKWREFRNLVLGGIPVEYRAKVWSECSGASALRVPGYYDDLVRGNADDDSDPTVVAQIGMDIRRTLTDNIFFRKGPGVKKLNEVLLAYSRRNPEVGYCQGMNLIAGSLLLIMPTAEDAFWVMASMIENILPAHYYDHGFVASRADQQVLRQYVAEILPNLSAHFDDLGIELEALTFQWFLSIFTDCLSAEALYRVWDVVLCLNAPTTVPALQAQSQAVADTTNTTPNTATPTSTTTPASRPSVEPAPMSPMPFSTVESEISSNSSGGGSTFFFQVALALLKLNEQQLLTCSTPAAIYSYINHQMTNHAISIDGLIQASEALRNVIKREDVLLRRAVALKETRAAHESLSQPTTTSASSV